jgi:hypothetical protein
MDILEFRRVFDFIEEKMPSTCLNDEQLREVYQEYEEWSIPYDGIGEISDESNDLIPVYERSLTFGSYYKIASVTKSENEKHIGKVFVVSTEQGLPGYKVRFISRDGTTYIFSHEDAKWIKVQGYEYE